jgi:hypothetical protein
MEHYKSLEELYSHALELAEGIKKCVYTRHEAVEHLRVSLDRAVRWRCFDIATLDNPQMQLLETKNPSVCLSLENTVKNMLHHCELTLDDYFKIPQIINDPDILAFKVENRVNKLIYYTSKNNLFQAVVKTTVNRAENYLVSYYRVNLTEIERQTSRDNIRVIFRK